MIYKQPFSAGDEARSTEQLKWLYFVIQLVESSWMVPYSPKVAGILACHEKVEFSITQESVISTFSLSCSSDKTELL